MKKTTTKIITAGTQNFLEAPGKMGKYLRKT
jgi:hypothetical protein